MNRKAPGQDNVKAELLRASPGLAAQIRLPLFAAIWERKKTQDE